MDPAMMEGLSKMGGSAISGGLGVLGQVLGMNAAEAARKKQQRIDANNQSFATQAAANNQMQQGQTSAFQQMMEGYRSALS